MYMALAPLAANKCAEARPIPSYGGATQICYSGCPAGYLIGIGNWYLPRSRNLCNCNTRLATVWHGRRCRSSPVMMHTFPCSCLSKQSIVRLNFSCFWVKVETDAHFPADCLAIVSSGCK